jgi:SpoVK/Ycf46/Vps4 family AAA+-type ATPase
MFLRNDEVEFDEFIPETDIEEVENESQNKSLAILDRIDRIIKIHFSLQKHFDNKEKKTKYQEILNGHLTICSDILGITTFQMLLFSYILNRSGSIMLKNFAKFLKVTRVQCLKYLDDLDVLVNKRLIRKSGRGFESDFNYWIPFEVIQALREGKAFTPLRSCGLSKDEFFKHLSRLFMGINEERGITKEIFLMDFFNLLDDNNQLEFVKNINRLSLTKENLIFISYLCTQFYTKQAGIFPLQSFNYHDNFFNDGNREHFIWKNIDLDKLFELKLIEYSGDDFKDKDHIVLTHKTIIELLGITEAMLKSETDSELINHENILKKDLFYNENDGRQIEQLTGLLIEENFIKVMGRLKLKGLRTSFSCLFFGAPGTGKTETAYQIARMSNRDIMPIDISATKSHWFGQSEKIIKDIFMQYHNRVKKANNRKLPVPILLLNEADAVINKRKDTSISGVAQTENAIQNILLEELEKLDGIMIATTNLTENIDTAFERRFIYKINFQKPCVKTRQSIWRSFIPELTKENVIKLAENFDLSGGQIENIVRKHTIVGILDGNEPEFSALIKFCGEETMLKNDSKIGF